jgi:hypothetical protein
MVIALAGPAVNVVLALVLWIGLKGRRHPRPDGPGRRALLRPALAGSCLR